MIAKTHGSPPGAYASLGEAPEVPFTLVDAVDAHARHRPDATALIEDDRSVSWAEFRRGVDRMSDGLRARGLGRGSVVAAADTMCVDLVTLYLATAHLGVVLVPLNTNLPQRTLAMYVERTRPDLVVVGEPFAGLVGTHGDRVVVVSRGRETWGRQLLGTPERDTAPGGRFDDPHLVIFTSGTTGVPKAAVLSQRGTFFDAMAGALAAGLRPDDRLFCYQAPYHTGTWAMMRQYLVLGASVVLCRSFDAERAVELLEHHQCTSLFAVPLMLQKLVETAAFAKADLSAFRHLVFASYDPSAVIAPVAQMFRDRGARRLTLEHIYGMTENSAFIATARAEFSEEDLTSVGIPVPGVNVSLRAEDGTEVAPGEIGEICVRSRSLMLGYLDDPEATVEAFRGGWLHTGDLGQLDRVGHLHIVGRIKEMVRTGGVNVYPREVAAVLSQHEAVVDCAVFGVPDSRYDERVVAAVVSSRPDLDPDELLAWLRRRLAGYQTPRQILLVPELPKTAVGKTAMAELVHLATSAGAS